MTIIKGLMYLVPPLTTANEPKYPLNICPIIIMAPTNQIILPEKMNITNAAKLEAKFKNFATEVALTKFWPRKATPAVAKKE
ncbi:MAG: hypothetical protein HRU28_15855, partial [Rhizobiales bacterium]|nr:hypothetical protein [Hyphomicrobiales bacterium]